MDWLRLARLYPLLLWARFIELVLQARDYPPRTIGVSLFLVV